MESCTYEEGEGYFQEAIKSIINMVKWNFKMTVHKLRNNQLDTAEHFLPDITVIYKNAVAKTPLVKANVFCIFNSYIILSHTDFIWRF